MATDDDDVTRLLASVGGGQSTYRRFDQDRSDGPGAQGAPLIDAIFGHGGGAPPTENRKTAPPEMPARPDPVLELLGAPPSGEPPQQPAAPLLPTVAVPEPKPLFEPRRSVGSDAPGRRSLRTFREILSGVVETGGARPGGPSRLTGLFDRLAR